MTVNGGVHVPQSTFLFRGVTVAFAGMTLDVSNLIPPHFE